MELHDIAVEDAHPLRRSVLRGGRPDAEVTYTEDADPDTFHLGGLVDGRVVAVATVAPAPTPLRPGARAWRLRGMAVDPELQGCGMGRRIMDEIFTRVRSRDGQVLWADGRDTALGFYSRVGMEVVGDGFVPPGSTLPHHVVIIDL
ncbi:MAG TPA: GNAT family N-acetyltransferase [Acidimicrobiales bacterium]|nr:GNAT family N-acetyltransferase [Acidimicrobiales bacterium]